MAKIQGGKLIINGQAVPLWSSQIVNHATGQKLDEQIAALETALADLSGTEIEQLKTQLTELKTTFQTFMTGEDDDNGALDRLKELVAAIEANKDSIDALVSDKATKAELEAVIAGVAALEAKNWTVLDGIGKSETIGNLTFNGKELTGETGIAIGASVEAATQYNGKIQIILEEIEVPEAKPAA